MAQRQRLEDRVIEAITLLTRASNTYFEDLAASFSEHLGRGTIQPLMVLHRDGPQRVSALAVSLGLDRTTVTRHLDELAQRGLIDRQPDERDRRALVVSLTPMAADHLNAMRTKNRQRIRRVFADWTPQEREMFGEMLIRFARRGAEEFRD
ncbi:MarR family winged helix-turn-helix transcriptional regulator [Umezawaea endophytica]|uniref:MarR family transcriptional regulator n=1 Tax=Umezawaea endophytica TaxID=1654476 RepID=A0A9X2VMC9_9PSEU|nr:MarR family transcriptional regulator [Umezawaea endophytica]MCS7479157.1 MarR family transcriptional regulator [Umezawaea endophytica]